MLIQNTDQSPHGDSRDNVLLDRFLHDICETDPRNEKIRIEQSKGGVLGQCYNWVFQCPELQAWQESKDTRLLWLKGTPGKGKTMAMIGLVDTLTDQMNAQSRSYLPYFFCQNSIPHLNNANSVLRALIWKLLWMNRSLSKYIPDEYICKRDRGREIFDGPNAFAILTGMLAVMLRDPSLNTVFLLIDALDECDSGMRALLDWIIKESLDGSTKAKWILSSRDYPEIKERFCPGSSSLCLSLDSNEAYVAQAVNYFIEHKIEQLAQMKELSFPLQKEIEMELKVKAGATFLWVSLACQRLQATSRRKMRNELDGLPSGLQPLYDRMLQLIEENEDEDDKALCKQMLRTTAIAYRSLNLRELTSAANLPEDCMDDISQLVELCSSFLIIRQGYVFAVHQSARDYFCMGAGQRIFADGVIHEHGTMVQRLLDAMDTTLMRNVYGLHYPGCSLNEIKHPQPNPLAPLQYAATYWVNHLITFCRQKRTQHCHIGLSDGGRIDTFVKKHILHWLEALSLMGYMSKAVVMIRELKDFLEVCTLDRINVVILLISPRDLPQTRLSC